MPLLDRLESSQQELHRVLSPDCPPTDVRPSSEALLYLSNAIVYVFCTYYVFSSFLLCCSLKQVRLSFVQ